MKKLLYIISVVLVLLGVSGIIIIANNDKSLYINNFEIINPKLPREMGELKIAHLSDYHSHGLNYQEDNLIDIVLKNNPDIICFTGDFIDDGTTQNNLNEIRDLFDAFKNIPVFLINGNHEFDAKGQKEYYATIMEYENIHFLKNEIVRLYSSTNSSYINIIGMDDAAFHGGLNQEEYASIALKEIENQLFNYNEFNLFLAHNPDTFDVYSRYASLQLSGHTHGGQINFPFNKLIYKYRSGLYQSGDSTLIVSEGLGTSAYLPIRVGTRLEVNFITLKNNNE